MSEVLERDEQDTQELPVGWIRSHFGAIGEYINGRAFKPTEWGDEGRPILRIQNLTGSTRTVNRFNGVLEDKYIVRDDDLLISWSATLDAYIYRGEEAALNQHIFKVLPYTNKKFLYFGTLNYIGELRAKVQGSAMQHITKGNFEETRFFLPPLAEQERIVTKLEELFTRLDAGIVSVKKTQVLLKRYRQSVLKSAVEGKLSREWREAQGDTLEDAETLLERILDERREKWTASGRRGQYEEPEAPDLQGLQTLPKGWTWATFEQLGEWGGGGTPRLC